MKKVLIIDDDVLNRDVLSKVLYKEYIETQEAIDGYEAMTLLKRDAYDLILCDLMMPQVDGFTLIKYIRQELKMKTPIIVLSALGNEENITKAKALGADNYMVKPLNIKSLMKNIKEYLYE